MKVTSTNLPQTAHDLARPAAAGRGRESFAAVAANLGQTQETPATAKSADAHGPKALPPGLEKVQARLQEIAAGERTRGQERALSAISANIARYAEAQAGTPLPEAAPADTTPAAAETAASDTGTTA